MTATTFEERLRALESQFSAHVSKLERERDDYRKLVLLLQEENERLKRGLLGQREERLPKNDAQLSLAILGMMVSGAPSEESTPEAAAAPEQVVAEHTRKKPVRKTLSEAWPRVNIEILPPEVQRDGLDAFEVVGADSREVLERRPASTVVVRLVYTKFVRKDRARNGPTDVLRADAVELPIERGIAGPAASPVLACSPTASCAAGKITSRSTASKRSTHERVCRWQSRRSARGMTSWQSSRDRSSK